MEFNLQELYEFANVSSPGGNHYTVEETNRIWNTDKGKELMKLCDPNSFAHHFLMIKIYGNMAQRYSGVIDTADYETLNNLYEFMSQAKLPNGYKFYTIYDGGYKLVLRKDSEPLKNMDVRTGVEHYGDIPDSVHRPPYHLKTKVVSENLTITLEEFERKKKNKEIMDKAIDKLYQFRHSIQEKNVQTFLNKITNYDRHQLLDIVDHIYDNSEELDYEEDYQEYSEKTLLNIIKFELEHSYYDWVRNIIMKF
jgi:hypothetical protein